MDRYASDGPESIEDAASPAGVLEQKSSLTELIENHDPVTIDLAQHPFQRLLCSGAVFCSMWRPRCNCGT